MTCDILFLDNISNLYFGERNPNSGSHSQEKEGLILVPRTGFSHARGGVSSCHLLACLPYTPSPIHRGQSEQLWEWWGKILELGLVKQLSEDTN